MTTENRPVVTLSVDQLQAIVDSAVKAAVSAIGTKPKASRQPKAEDPEAASKAAAKQARAEKYLADKKGVALRLAREKGVHYHVCKKGRRLLVWSDDTIERNRRKGLNPSESLGTSVWNTAEGGFRLYMARSG